MSLHLNDETETIIASIAAIVAADYLDAQARHEKLAEISAAVDEAMFDLEAAHGIDPLDDFDDEDDEYEIVDDFDDDDDWDEDWDDEDDDFDDDFEDDDDDFEDDEEEDEDE